MNFETNSKKKILVIIVISFSIISLFFIKLIYPYLIKTKSLNKLFINNHPITIEIADTDEKRSKGLSNRDSIEQDHGMLFIFPSKGVYYFWMKDMKIPLDFVWIDQDTVVDLTENISHVNSNSDEIPIFTAKVAFDKVLEINSGDIKRIGINIGDKVKIN
jgi:hypothetical protein